MNTLPMILQDLERAVIRKHPYPFMRGAISWDSNFVRELNSEIYALDPSWWHRYDSRIEKKTTLSDWSRFGPQIYRVFSYLCGNNVSTLLGKKFGYKELVPDFGLHGGGIHSCEDGGILNPHLDYDLHPRTLFRRRVNLVIYINPLFHSATHGGALGLYAKSDNLDFSGDLVEELAIEGLCFIAFDTSRHSWHGLTSPVRGQRRLSLAMYYVEPTERDSDSSGARTRVKFSPTIGQRNNKIVLEDICHR